MSNFESEVFENNTVDVGGEFRRQSYKSEKRIHAVRGESSADFLLPDYADH